MAWYRAGGGGIPSAIKTDMNAVLNKKFETSQDYPPTDWAPSVNLMGPLPEKTVSGSVANITDGADGVPVKNWGVTVDATLSGVSAVVCTQAGKNLMSAPTFSASTDSLCLDFGFDITVSSLTLSFLATASEVDNISSAIVDFRKSDGTHYYRTLNDFKDISNVSFSATSPNNGVFKYTLTSRTFRYLYVSYTSGTRSKFTSDSLSNWQLEVGSTATAYEAYTAPTVTTVSLGRTIYGGSVDVVNGAGTDENGNDFTFTPITPTPETALGVNNFWANEGDSEVTYRADIDLLLGGN